MSLSDLVEFGQVGHPLARMPVRDPGRGIDMSTGALGQGLSFACGLAVAARRLDRSSRVFTLLGDAECTEGQTWEAAMTAGRLGLRNVVGLLDANGHGSVIAVDRVAWTARWAAFGWNVVDVDGHDVGAIAEVLRDTRDVSAPSMVILHTTKGRGLLPPLEGSSSLSSEADPAFMPPFDLDADWARAKQAIERISRPIDAVEPASVTAGQPTRARVLRDLRGLTPGASALTKQVGGDLAVEITAVPTLMLAPDAIRNSGLLQRMREIGSWSFDNPKSNILECAIAEQDAASLAAGAAAGGLRPVLFSMEGFYWRMLDQIRESIAFQRLPVILVGTSGGLGDPLGPMVQSDRLLAVLTQMLDIEIFEASDANWAKLLFAECVAAARPCYLRLPHEPAVVMERLEVLAGTDLADGCDVAVEVDDPDITIVTAGSMVSVARETATTVERRGMRCRVVDVFGLSRFARLDDRIRQRFVAAKVLSVSLHNAPSTVLGRFLPRTGLAIGVDGYGMSGWPVSKLYDAAGLTADAIAARILNAADR